jgi:glycosyltransferase involved in cell wall biosynthesis
MTSPSWARHHEALWRRPVAVVPNGHDEAAGSRLATNGTDGTVTYVGSYYPRTQDLSAAWSGIRRLVEAGEPVPDRIHIVGEPHPEMLRQIAEQGLADRVHATGFVAHDEALSAMRSSSALLLAGPRNAVGILRGQVAGKVWEYLATGLPIVYVGDPDCDVADVLRSHDGCHLVATGDTDAAARALAAACRGRHQVRNLATTSRRAQAARLAAVLDATYTRAAPRST